MDNDLLVARVQRLEDVAFEGRGLLEAVEALGQSAGALADALKQVDRQHQTLASFGEALQAVQENAVPRSEFEQARVSSHEEAQQFAKAALRRTYLTVVFVACAFVVGGLVLDAVFDHRRQGQVRVCEQRNAQTELIVGVLAEQGLAEDAAKFRNLVIDCQEAL